MSERYEFEPEPMTEEQRRDLLARFVLGTPLPDWYDHPVHDNTFDQAPDPNTYPEDCP